MAYAEKGAAKFAGSVVEENLEWTGATHGARQRHSATWARESGQTDLALEILERCLERRDFVLLYLSI